MLLIIIFILWFFKVLIVVCILLMLFKWNGFNMIIFILYNFIKLIMVDSDVVFLLRVIGGIVLFIMLLSMEIFLNGFLI